jgi:hypothetical protein
MQPWPSPRAGCASVKGNLREWCGRSAKREPAAPFYSPDRDIVQMPELPTFRDRESYYATLAHETTHWTRHPSRLDRDLGCKRFADAGYAMEELVAEIGAAFLCADLGITPETRDDHAAYIASWLKVLKDASGRSSPPPAMRRRPPIICTACSRRRNHESRALYCHRRQALPLEGHS